MVIRPSPLPFIVALGSKPSPESRTMRWVLTVQELGCKVRAIPLWPKRPRPKDHYSPVSRERREQPCPTLRIFLSVYSPWYFFSVSHRSHRQTRTQTRSRIGMQSPYSLSPTRRALPRHAAIRPLRHCTPAQAVSSTARWWRPLYTTPSSLTVRDSGRMPYASPEHLVRSTRQWPQRRMTCYQPLSVRSLKYRHDLWKLSDGAWADWRPWYRRRRRGCGCYHRAARRRWKLSELQPAASAAAS